jgi:GxxExxY protein
MTKKEINELQYEVIGACIEVHKALGPGLLGSVYHKCLKQEFYLRKLSYRFEHAVKIDFKGIELDSELRCDFVIEDKIALEIKTVEGLLPVHEAQTLTYMKLLGMPKSILINFNVENLYKSGQRVFASEKFRELKDE